MFTLASVVAGTPEHQVVLFRNVTAIMRHQTGLAQLALVHGMNLLMARATNPAQLLLAPDGCGTEVAAALSSSTDPDVIVCTSMGPRSTSKANMRAGVACAGQLPVPRHGSLQVTRSY